MAGRTTEERAALRKLADGLDLVAGALRELAGEPSEPAVRTSTLEVVARGVDGQPMVSSKVVLSPSADGSASELDMSEEERAKLSPAKRELLGAIGEVLLRERTAAQGEVCKVTDKSILWFGPVSKMQIGASVPSGFGLAIRGCTGDGSDGKQRCVEYADQWSGPDGRRLPKTRAALRVAGEVAAVAAFSAGGQIVKRLALHAADRAEIGAVYLADATYTDAWKVRGKQAGVDAALMGFVLFALDAIKDGRPMVATASAFANRDYPTGAQTLAAVWAEIEARAGRTFDDASADPLLEGLKAPVRAGRMGSVLLCDFGFVYKHGEHATVIAPAILPRMLSQPRAAQVTEAPASAAPPDAPVAPASTVEAPTPPDEPIAPAPTAERPRSVRAVLAWLFSHLLR